MKNVETGLPKFKIGASKRKLKRVYDHSIYYDNRVFNDLKELNDLLLKHFEEQRARFDDINYKPTEYKFYFNTEYDESSIEITMELYRPETDTEVDLRLKVEEKLKKARENAAIKRKAALEIKRKKQEELEKNPNYQELQKLKIMKAALEKKLGIKTKKKK